MIRRSFIATVLIAAGLRKATEEKVCFVEIWDRVDDGEYEYSCIPWEQWKPERVASETFNHEDLEKYFEQLWSVPWRMTRPIVVDPHTHGILTGLTE